MKILASWKNLESCDPSIETCQTDKRIVDILKTFKMSWKMKKLCKYLENKNNQIGQDNQLSLLHT